MDFLPQLNAFSVFLGNRRGRIPLPDDLAVLRRGLRAFRRRPRPRPRPRRSGFFSTRVMSVFITAFGGFGAIATEYRLRTAGRLGHRVRRRVCCWPRRSTSSPGSSTASRHPPTAALRTSSGQVGRVVVAIPAGGVGQVRVRIGEELVDKIARGREPEAIAENASVVVEEVLGETIIVKNGEQRGAPMLPDLS